MGGRYQLMSHQLLTGDRPSENNVLFCPRMNAAAMRTGEFLCFYSGRPPAFFLYRPSRIGQL
jgi:hypothetical protein